MIYPIHTQRKKSARKDYNYWGLFSTLLILLVWNLELMVAYIVFMADFINIKFRVKIAEEEELIGSLIGFGAAMLSLVILHL